MTDFLRELIALCRKHKLELSYDGCGSHEIAVTPIGFHSNEGLLVIDDSAADILSDFVATPEVLEAISGDRA